MERCDYLENNPNELKEEWEALLAKAKEMCSVLETHASGLDHNKTKNRYSDILPCKLKLYVKLKLMYSSIISENQSIFLQTIIPE